MIPEAWMVWRRHTYEQGSKNSQPREAGWLLKAPAYEDQEDRAHNERWDCTKALTACDGRALSTYKSHAGVRQRKRHHEWSQKEQPGQSEHAVDAKRASHGRDSDEEGAATLEQQERRCEHHRR